MTLAALTSKRWRHHHETWQPSLTTLEEIIPQNIPKRHLIGNYTSTLPWTAACYRTRANSNSRNTNIYIHIFM